jgi:hypothetical protein
LVTAPNRYPTSFSRKSQAVSSSQKRRKRKVKTVDHHPKRRVGTAVTDRNESAALKTTIQIIATATATTEKSRGGKSADAERAQEEALAGA